MLTRVCLCIETVNEESQYVLAERGLREMDRAENGLP
jgi:hypothetical protein